MNIFKKATVFAISSLVAGSALADVTVHGEVLANLNMQQNMKTNDKKANEFNLDRARIITKKKFSDKWSAVVDFEAQTENSSKTSATIKKAFIKGEGVFTDSDKVMFGIHTNPYIKATYKHWNYRWLGESAVQSDKGNNYSTEFTGVTWSNMAGNFGYALSLHNGHGQLDEVFGLALFLGFKINDAMAIHLNMDQRGEAKYAAQAKEDLMHFNFTYNHDMFDAIVEYSSKKVGTGDAATTTGLRFNYKMGDSGILFAYDMFNETTYASNNYENEMSLGYHTMLAEGLNTGIFYTMAKYNDNNAATTTDSDSDDNRIEWKWGAKF